MFPTTKFTFIPLNHAWIHVGKNSKEMNFLVEQFRAHQGVSKVGFLVSPIIRKRGSSKVQTQIPSGMYNI